MAYRFLEVQEFQRLILVDDLWNNEKMELQLFFIELIAKAIHSEPPTYSLVFKWNKFRQTNGCKLER
jgi:hypothetical protein